MFKWLKPYLEKWDAVAQTILLLLNDLRGKGLKIRLDLHDNPVLDSWGLEDVEIFVTLGDGKCAPTSSKKTTSTNSTPQ